MVVYYAQITLEKKTEKLIKKLKKLVHEICQSLRTSM